MKSGKPADGVVSPASVPHGPMYLSRIHSGLIKYPFRTKPLLNPKPFKALRYKYPFRTKP